MSKIEWTEKTWNPIVSGCTMISKGCSYCYAMKFAYRHSFNAKNAKNAKKYSGVTKKTKSGNIVWNGKININLNDEALLLPLKIKKSTMFFVNSMSDLFHEDVPFDAIDEIIAIIAQSPQHTFQILTKRSERMIEYFSQMKESNIFNLILKKYNASLKHCFFIGEHLNYNGFLPNVWLGVSVENQETLFRMDLLKQVPSNVRFLSLEPLLEDLGEIDLSGIDWVIVGGESGHGARHCEIEWLENIVTQCQTNKVPVFVKQLGTVLGKQLGVDHKDMSVFPKNLQVREYPKTDNHHGNK